LKLKKDRPKEIITEKNNNNVRMRNFSIFAKKDNQKEGKTQAQIDQETLAKELEEIEMIKNKYIDRRSNLKLSDYLNDQNDPIRFFNFDKLKYEFTEQ